jgi:hypothetical protein
MAPQQQNFLAQDDGASSSVHAHSLALLYVPQVMHHTKYRKQLSLVARCLPAQALEAAVTAAAPGRTGYQAGLVAMQACLLTVGSQPAVLR